MILVANKPSRHFIGCRNRTLLVAADSLRSVSSEEAAAAEVAGKNSVSSGETRQDDALEATVRGGIQSINQNNYTMLLRLMWAHPGGAPWSEKKSALRARVPLTTRRRKRRAPPSGAPRNQIC